jgi:hypothetical protein
MNKIPSFDDFIKTSTPVTNEEQVLNTDDNLIPEAARKKLWEFMYMCAESAIQYEDDSVDSHNIGEYLKEAAHLMANMASKSLKENKILLKLAEKAIEKNSVVDEKESKEKIKEYVKSRLDEACDKIHEGFNKGIEKSRLDNAGIAAMVAAEMMKG